MKNLNFKNLFFNALVLFLVGSLFMGASPELAVASVAIGFVTGTALSFANLPKAAFMAIQVEIWENHIEEEIFKDNSFLTHAKNASDNVVDSKYVHIPQSGGSGNIVKNRTNLPAAVRERVDTDVIYQLNEYTSDPFFLPDADTHELSYDKRNSALGEDRDKIVEFVAEDTIYNWLNSPVYGAYGATKLPANYIYETSGDSKAATAPNATGNRKKATINDLQRMRVAFKNQKRWFEGKMYCLLTPEMEAEMFPANSLTTATYMQKVTEEERRNGVMFKAQGWNIMSRNTVAIVLGNGTDVAAPGAVGNTDDDEASLFWYEQAVEFAMGAVKAFQNLGDPTYYGDIYSFLVRSGGRSVRADYKGLALLKEAKAV